MYPSDPSHWKKRRAFFFLFVLLSGFGLTALVMVLWNALLPDLFQVPRINYWQAFGLFVLCRLLFGKFHFGGPRRPPFAQPDWKAKWMNMSEEERMRFKSRWQDRCRPKE
jgi:hypothetical protein